MPPLTVVGRRSSPVLHEEQREMALRRVEVVRIQRPQHGISLDPFVEPVDERREERLPANGAKDVELHQEPVKRGSALYLGAESLTDEGGNLACLGVSPQCRLGEDQLTVDGHLESSLRRRQELDL